MRGRWGVLGLFLWLVGTIVAAVAVRGNVAVTPVSLSLADGTKLRGAWYRSRSPWAPIPAPVALVLHGTALSHESCAPALSIPLARSGFAALAIDLPGHGRSQGRMRRSEYDDLARMLDTPAEAPEVTAALNFCRTCKDVDASRIVLVGHSRGGWTAAAAGRLPEVASVISVCCGATCCDPKSPRNLLLLDGDLDEIIPESQYRAALARATGGTDEAGVVFGDMDAGTARALFLAPWRTHLSMLVDPVTSRRAVQWACWSTGLNPGEVSGDRLMIAGTALLLAAAGAGLAIATFVAGAARRLLPPRSERTDAPRFSPGLPAGFLLIALATPPAAVGLARLLPDFGVLFASNALALVLIPSVLALFVGRWATPPAPPAAPRAIRSGVSLGFLGALTVLTLFGVPSGLTWLNPVPTTGRLALVLVLTILFLPLCLALAHGVERGLARSGDTPVLRGLVWVGLAVFLAGGHLLLVRTRHPFLAIPTLLVASGSLVSLPLWLLAPRPGMCTARAVSHALGVACFLGWHLPLVRG
jgi:pimeloyl-ACP methyl ester carboxylesterase